MDFSAYMKAGCLEKMIENRLNRTSCVVTVPETEADAFDYACARLTENGFEKKESYFENGHAFCAFSRGDEGVYMNHFAGTKELRMVHEENTAYFSVSDETAGCFRPFVTMISLEDFGLSCVIRLSDGRFIVIDGGRKLDVEADKLYECLRGGSAFGKPVIAAWILSHPHGDHFHCFINFMDRYKEAVEIERIVFSFPEADDTEHYPALAQENNTPYGDLSGVLNIPLMLERARESGALLYAPHTGQRFAIGDAKMEILSSMDDTLHLSRHINASAIVIKMHLGGQTILWTTDASFSIGKLPERYTEALKADILQIPHHGFQSGTAEAEIEGYKWIRPDICLLPANDYVAYTFFCQIRKGTEYLMKSESVKEIITGETQRTLYLPYTPSGEEKKKREALLADGRAASGARSWVFTGLRAENPEDFRFTVLNMVIPPAGIQIDLFFEEKKKAVRYIKTVVEGGFMKKINILSEDVDDDALMYNIASLRKRGVPENGEFAVRFLSDVPVVVFHEKHRETYHD